MKSLRFVLFIAALGGAFGISAAGEPSATWKSRVDRLALPLLESKKTVGLAVGILTPSGNREFYAYGVAKTGGNEPRLDTVYEIGSISKPITALLLALMIEAGEAKLDDSVRTYLPKEMEVPIRGDREITLLELATHTSGLPRMPSNFSVSLVAAAMTDKLAAQNPYAQYDAKKLAAGLKTAKLKDIARPDVTYSNLGFGLLGDALAHKAGTSYEDLLRSRITGPLGMKSTFVALPDDQAKFATAHNAKGDPVSGWTFGCMHGCGAIRSTADDMLTFLEVCSGRRVTKLEKAMLMTQEKRTISSARWDIGLGWFMGHDPATRHWWHNGGTGGFATYLAYSRNPGVGIVVLSNQERVPGSPYLTVDHLGDTLIRELVAAGRKK